MTFYKELFKTMTAEEVMTYCDKHEIMCDEFLFDNHIDIGMDIENLPDEVVDRIGPILWTYEGAFEQTETTDGVEVNIHWD